MTTRSLNWLAGFFLFASGAWLAHAKAFADHHWSDNTAWLAPLYTHQFVVYSLLLLIAAILKAIALFKGMRSTKALVQKLLDGLVAEVMKTPNTFGAQDYRVTLFKFKRYSLLESYRRLRRGDKRKPCDG